MNHLGRFLLVEDDPRDVELTLMALEKLANEVTVARDGKEALDYLYCRGNSALAPAATPPSCCWI
jgi:CheY-like chemotaxis protein